MASSVIEKSLASDVELSNNLNGFIVANSNITNLERNFIRRFGKLVVVDITFTVGTAITDSTAVLFTGLPKAYAGSQRFRLPHGYDTSTLPLVLAITPEGRIINQWSSGGVQPGQWQGQFCYITSE